MRGSTDSVFASPLIVERDRNGVGAVQLGRLVRFGRFRRRGGRPDDTGFRHRRHCGQTGGTQKSAPCKFAFLFVHRAVINLLRHTGLQRCRLLRQNFAAEVPAATPTKFPLGHQFNRRLYARPSDCESNWQRISANR